MAEQLVAKLEALPPAVNKYLAAAEAIGDIIAPAKSAPWLHKMTIGFAILFVIQTLISIVTVVSLIKVSEKFWLVRLGRDGIYLPNTQVLWATLSGMFCAFNATNLIWQVLIDDGKATPRHKIVTEGLRWLPMVTSDWIFCHGLVAQSLTRRGDNDRKAHLTSDLSTIGNPPKRLISTRFLCTVLNVSAVLVPAIWAAGVLSLLLIADKAVSDAMDATMSAVTPLILAAPSYNPATFSMENFLPMLAPVAAIIPPAERFARYIKICWIFYSVIICSLTVWFLPFLIHHLVMLHRLMGSASLFHACFNWRRQRSDTSLMGLSNDPSTPNPGSSNQRSSEQKLDYFAQSGSSRQGDNIKMARFVATRSAQVTTPVAPMPAMRHAPKKSLQPSESRKGNLSSQASGLMWSSVLIYLATAYYCPLAIYASCTTLKDPVFWAFVIPYGSGGYAVFGLLVHITVISRNFAVLRARRRQVLASESKIDHAFSPFRAGRRKGRSPLDTITVERTTIAPRDGQGGVWIQTRTETTSDHHHAVPGPPFALGRLEEDDEDKGEVTYKEDVDDEYGESGASIHQIRVLPQRSQHGQAKAQ